MAGTPKKLVGPIALTTTYTTDVYVPASALVYDVVRHIHVTNKLLVDTFRLYLGASVTNAAGTELFYNQSVAATSSFDHYTALKLTSTTVLVGGAATTLTLVITIAGESYVV